MTTTEAILSVGIGIEMFLTFIWFAILRVGDKIEKLKRP